MPCLTVDKTALEHAAAMTFVKTTPSADNGCWWQTARIGVGVQVSVHPGWTASRIALLKARSQVIDVRIPGASQAVVMRASVAASEVDNVFAFYPQGAILVAVTGAPAIVTAARAVSVTRVITG